MMTADKFAKLTRHLIAMGCIAMLVCCLVSCAGQGVDMDYGKDTVYLSNQWVVLGSYPRTEVDADLTARLAAAYYAGTLKQDGEWYAYQGKRYARVQVVNNYVYEDTSDRDFFDFTRYDIGTVHWFEVEPIRWRVLNRQGKYAVLVTEELVDAGSYCEQDAVKGYLWENSDLRAWLNGSFYAAAFSAEEQILLQTMLSPCYYISNPGRYKYERASVQDKVRLLEWREARLPQHFADDDARLARATDYAASRGCARLTPEVIVDRFEEDPADYEKYMQCGIYWLSDTELNSNHVYIVYEFGNTLSYSPYVKNRGIRPVITVQYDRLTLA